MFSSKRVRALVPALMFGYILAILVSAQVAPDGPLEKDGYYHARLSAIYAERGLLRTFPWTQQSTWKDTFCDKELLYHGLLLPFTAGQEEPIQGALAATVLLNLAIIVLLFWILRRRQVTWPILYAALPFCLGGIFVARFTMVRSHVLSIALLLIGVHLLLDKRWRALLLLGFVYAWSYTVPYVLVMSAFPFVVGAALMRGGFDWRSLLAATAGVTLGLTIHPYSPHTLESLLTYVQVISSGAQGMKASGIELGRELYPLSVEHLVTYFPLMVVGAPAMAVLAWMGRGRLTPPTVGALFTALFWVGMTLRFARFNEYAVPLLALAAGLVARDLLIRPATVEGEEPADEPWWRQRRRQLLLGLAVVLLAAHGLTLKHLADYLRLGEAPRFRGAVKWMSKNLSPGETVLNMYWDDFPDLFYDGHRQRYIWGLDPVYTFRHDPALARYLEDVRARRVPFVGEELARKFKTRILVLRRKRVGRYKPLVAGTYPPIYMDKKAVLFDLTPGKPRGPASP